MVGVGATPVWLSRALYASDALSPRKKILVAIFQRGAVDGLNVVVPHGEKRYYDLRPTIAVPRPDGTPDSAIDLDGFFGLHPSLRALKPVYDSGHMAIVHAAGSPDPTRSHFDAQDYMESGTPGFKSTSDGWLNRAIPPDGKSPVQAVSLTPDLPRALRGRNSAVAINNVKDFQVRDPQGASSFESMYENTGDKFLNGTGRETFEAVKLMQSIQKQGYTPANGANYPGGRLGQSMKQIAQLVKSDVGLEVAFTDVQGWDTHHNQGSVEGQLSNRLRDFSASIAAFWQDMGDDAENVTLVTMSEFGRTARENGTGGTDHGHANAMFVLGGDVKGGKVYGRWPGLDNDQLNQGRDQALTTDYRQVLAEVVNKTLGAAKYDLVFPGAGLGTERFLRLV